MKYIVWDQLKNEKLKLEREISFEDVFNRIEESKVLQISEHSNKRKYPNQRILIVEIENYIYFVPFVEDETKYFLKTIIPSRKLTKIYLKERKQK